MRLFDYELNKSAFNYEGVVIGIIGAGKMAKIHSQVLKREFRNINLKAICSRSIESALALKSEFQYEKAYNNFVLMLDENPDINAVILAVSHEQSFEILKKIIPYQKYILAEKPASFSYKDISELTKLAKDSGTEVMVAVNRRFYENYNDAYFEILRRGNLKSMNVEINEPLWNYRSRRQFSNWVYTSWPVANSIHFIDLIRYFLGDAEHIEILNRGEQYNIKAYIKLANGDSFVNIVYNSSAPSGHKIFGNGISADFIVDNTIYCTNSSDSFKHSLTESTYKPGILGQMKYFIKSVYENSKISFPASNIEDHGKSIKLVEDIFGI